MMHGQRNIKFLPSSYVARFVLVQICLKIRCSVSACTSRVTERFIVLGGQQVGAVLVAKTVYREMLGRFMTTWEVRGSGLGLIKVLSRHWLRGTEKNGKNLQTRRSEREDTA